MENELFNGPYNEEVNKMFDAKPAVKGPVPKVMVVGPGHDKAAIERALGCKGDVVTIIDVNDSPEVLKAQIDKATKEYIPKEGEHVLWPGFPPVSDQKICDEASRIKRYDLWEKWSACANNEERKEMYRELAHYIRQHDRVPVRLDKYRNLDVPKGCKKDHVQLIAHWTDNVNVYEVTFSFELVFGSKNARIKRFNSWEAKFKGFLQNATMSEIVAEPGMKVKLVTTK